MFLFFISDHHPKVVLSMLILNKAVITQESWTQPWSVFYHLHSLSQIWFITCFVIQISDSVQNSDCKQIEHFFFSRVEWPYRFNSKSMKSASQKEQRPRHYFTKSTIFIISKLVRKHLFLSVFRFEFFPNWWRKTLHIRSVFIYLSILLLSFTF